MLSKFSNAMTALGLLFSMSSIFLSLLFPFCYAHRLLLSSLVVNVVDNLLPFYFYEIR